jgi:hypothetical protein
MFFPDPDFSIPDPDSESNKNKREKINKISLEFCLTISAIWWP